MRNLTALAISISFLFNLQAQIKDTLVVGYTPAPPFIIEQESGLEGISVWLWQQIASDLNLEFEYQRMEFSEMLNALESGTIDLSINPLTITGDRNRVMDFTYSYFVSNATIAVQQVSYWQKLQAATRLIFTGTFLRIFGILSLIIALFGTIAWLFERKGNPDQFRKGWKGLWDGLWWSVVTVTTVGYGDKAPKSGGGKLFAFIWMFTGLFMISLLTASVASSLTVTELKTNPQKLNDFKELPVGTVKNTSTQEFLSRNLFHDVNAFETVEKGLSSLAMKEITAFMYDEPILRYRMQMNPQCEDCELLAAKFNLQYYAFALPKFNAVLKDRISQKILEHIESLEWQIVLNEFGLQPL